jgi:hypothetical protein
MKKLKTYYYIGEVEEHNGEYEYNQKYLFKTSGTPEEYALKVARDWYGEDTDREREGDGFWHNGEVLTYAGSFERIPEEHFKVLKRYLMVL